MAWSHIQGAPQTDASNGNATTTIASGPSNAATVSGHLLVVWVSYLTSSAPTAVISSIADTGGSVFVKAVGPTAGSGGLANWKQEIWYAKSCIGAASNVVTATFSTSLLSQNAAISYEEYSGLDTSAPLNQAVGNASTATLAADNATSTAKTTTANGELIFGGAIFAITGVSGTGFTSRSTLGSNSDEDKLQTTAGSIAATFTNTGSSGDAYIAQMATFMLPAAGVVFRELAPAPAPGPQAGNSVSY